jgi:predicted RNA-binding Zn-ribbon protein involved in translation (DUF1610 family)
MLTTLPPDEYGFGGVHFKCPTCGAVKDISCGSIPLTARDLLGMRCPGYQCGLWWWTADVPDGEPGEAVDKAEFWRRYGEREARVKERT